MTQEPGDAEGLQEPSEPQDKPARRKQQIGPTFAAPEAHVHDLSSEILKLIPRAADERVTCRRISGNHYRCNWWAPEDTGTYDNPGMGGLTVTTHRIRRSQWLCVTRTGKGLTIEPPQG